MDFTNKLCALLIQESVGFATDKNVLMSPLSLNSCLRMVASGCLDETLSEFTSSFTANKEGAVLSALRFINKILVDNNFNFKNTPLEKIVKSNFNAQVSSLFFNASELSSSLPRDIVNHIKETVKLIIINELSFEDEWIRPFITSGESSIMDFTLVNGSKVKVPFMKFDGFLKCKSCTEFRAIEIFYKPRKVEEGKSPIQFSMVIYLPKKGLQTLLKKVDTNPEILALQGVEETNDLLSVWIPLFKFKDDNDISSEAMESLGVKSLFDGAFGVLKIIQKNSIEVNKRGTKASARTYTTVQYTSPRQGFGKFIVERPFMFTIREVNTKVVVFMGVVLDPSKVDV